MPHPNRNLLHTIYDSLAKGDVDPLVAAMTDDIQWRVHHPSPVAGIYTGTQEVLGFFSAMMAPYEGTLQVQVNAIVADDERGFVRVMESASRLVEGLAWTGVHVWAFETESVLGSRAITTMPTASSGRRDPRQPVNSEPRAQASGVTPEVTFVDENVTGASQTAPSTAKGTHLNPDACPQTHR